MQEESDKSELSIQRDVEEHDRVGFCFPLMIWRDLIIRLPVVDGFRILDSDRSKRPCDLGNRGRLL